MAHHPQPEAGEKECPDDHPEDAQAVTRRDESEDVEGHGLVLELLDGVPLEQLTHGRLSIREVTARERILGKDGSEVLERCGDREAERGRRTLLEAAVGDLIVPLEKSIELVALG